MHCRQFVIDLYTFMFMECSSELFCYATMRLLIMTRTVNLIGLHSSTADISFRVIVTKS